MKIAIIPVGMLGTNCYVLASAGGRCAVIDPGAQADKIAKLIDTEGLAPACILLTHGHHDHIGGVRRLMERYPDAVLYIGAGDLEMLADGDKSLAAIRSETPDEFIIENAEAVAEGRELPLDELTIRVLETPGHTKGGVVYLVDHVLFAGDTLFYGSVGRTDLYGGDYDVLLTSLRKLAGLPGDYTVYPGHGQSTTLDFERRNNDYVRESMR